MLNDEGPRSLNWPIGLGLLALAVAALPMVPNWLWGQQPEKPAVRSLQISKEDYDVDLAKAQAELDRAEAQLKQKLADLQGKRAALRKKEADHARTKTPEGATTIRIEISGLGGKPEDLAKLIRLLEKVLPGDKKRVITLAGQNTGVVRTVPDRDHLRELYRPVPIESGPIRLPGRAPDVRPLIPSESNPRPAALEKKLDDLLREIESLRRELRSRQPAQPGGFPARR
jgi:hypothetical protein